MKRKQVKILFGLLLVMLICLTGCNNKPEKDNQENAETSLSSSESKVVESSNKGEKVKRKENYR